uniref:phosphodiester glycosidase family protein n=1 Tax=Microbulbifer agarilyticus TaxID=260552 RepID=UPI0002558A79|nr:phosphodiester glycosidase family protein [Microbulbifer agarilyticus]
MRKHTAQVFFVALAMIAPFSDVGANDGELPDSVLFSSTEDGGHYLELPLADAVHLLAPRMRSTSLLMEDWALQKNTAAVINGGYFIGNTPVSLVVSGGHRLADGVSAVTRNGKSYPVLRSALWINKAGEARFDWVGIDISGVLKAFPEAMPYRRDQADPLPTPDSRSGEEISPAWAIGGGPRLLQGGAKAISYDEELFWGSGVELDDIRPRTAVCTTDRETLVLYVSSGATLHGLTQQLLALGCEDAMNLDGGGSSAMYVEGERVLDQQRAVPVVLAITAAR